MDKLSKDLIVKLVDGLSAQDFINFCAGDVSPNVVRICNMEEIWIRRLKKDFPKIVKEFPKVVESAKLVYLELFSRISKTAEEFVGIVLREYGEVRKFLTPDFKSFLYNIFYDLIVYTITEVLKGDYERGEEDEHWNWIFESVSDSYFSNKGTKILYKYLPGLRTREVNSLHAYQEKWQDEIESPLLEFVIHMTKFLLQYK